MLSENEVRAICLSFPDVVEKISWQRPTWFARTLFARMFDDDHLSVKSAERALLMRSRPEAFLVHPYGRADDDKVLVVLRLIDHDELEELLTKSYWLASG